MRPSELHRTVGPLGVVDGAHPGAGWVVVPAGTDAVSIFERPVFGTSARVVVWPPPVGKGVLDTIDRELEELDRQVSRFRTDSELVLAQSHPEVPALLSDGAAEALALALKAADVTRGLVDPTVGTSLSALGYDRDFAIIDETRQATSPAPPLPGWRAVRLDGRALRLPAGVQLDLGATAKGLGADRAAAAALTARGHGGVLISLGGDMAVAGIPPDGGWPIAVAEEPWPAALHPNAVVRLEHGGIATSSVLHRRWRQDRQVFHHVIDPSTGRPVRGRWRTATVVARNCVEANTASTAALVADGGAVDLLGRLGLPARLVSADGDTCLVGGWPPEHFGLLITPEHSIFEFPSARANG